MKKIVILNQSTLDDSYSEVDKACKNTWGSLHRDGLLILHYYGMYDNQFQVTSKFKVPNEEDKYIVDDNINLVLNTYDSTYPKEHQYYHINNDSRGEKLILSLEYCLDNLEFDFLLRTTCTSYVDIDKLLSYVDRLPDKKVYNGARNMYNYKIYFTSGYCSLMSRDVVEKVVENQDLFFSYGMPEDLSVGRLIIHDLNITTFDEQDNFHLVLNTISMEKIEEFQFKNHTDFLVYRSHKKQSKNMYHIHNEITGNM